MVIVIIIATAFLFIYMFFLKKQIGVQPNQRQIKKLNQLQYHKKGMVYNLEKTPQLAEGENFISVLFYFLFKKDRNSKPSLKIPSQKTILSQIKSNENILVWLGHSSYFIQIDGIKILVDPVMSGHASPLPFLIKAFDGTDIYTTQEIPEIDYLLITHDHYDHLDYKTVSSLNLKCKKIITGMGVGATLEFWGIPQEKITELVWNQKEIFEENIAISYLPTRHFSGRGFRRNQTLWGAFAIKTNHFNLYLGGDSDYGQHFKQAGQELGPFDLAVLENGQYDKRWRYIHMLPEDALKAAVDLKAKAIFPVHNSKFELSNHAWDAPLKEITRLNLKYQIPLKTPLIGEKMNLDDTNQKFSQWWLMEDQSAD